MSKQQISAPPKQKDQSYIAALPRVAIQAFCETPEISSIMQATSGDRRMDKTHLKVQMGGAAAAAESYRYSPTPNVIILESVNGRDEILDHLDTLAEVCDAGTKLVVIGHINDVVLYRELMRRGVSDYLITPITTVDVVRALSELFAAPDAEPVGRTIAVVGTRGGVGASTIAHNVAFGISKQLHIETVIADLDLPFGTGGLDFNQDPLQGIADAVFAPDRLDANLLDRLTSACGDHLNLLAAPSTLDRLYDFGETSFDGIVELLQSSVPAIVLDMPHMWTGWTRRLLVGADQIIIVASPDLASLRNAKNMLDIFRQARQHDSKPHLVMNMVGMPKRPEIPVNEFGKKLDIEIAATISFDPALFGVASNNGQMIAELQAKSKAAETLLDLSRLVTGRSEARMQKKSFLDPLLLKLSKKKS